MTFDALPALRPLVENAVRFVVIGGVAAQLRGSPSLTGDLDICYARDADNLERLVVVLRSINATLRGVHEDVPFILDAKTLKRGDSFTFDTDAGKFDCLGTPSGTEGYEELIVNATPMDIGDLEVMVASLDDVMRMKRAAGRPKDRVELEILGALREELERRGEL